MTNKKVILEWENTGIKDGTVAYEIFKVIAGSDKENLLFYSTFFSTINKFKKGEIYQLSTMSNFIEDNLGNIPGSFDNSGIIRGIDGGEYEFEKITHSLFIKEIWEEKEKNIENLILLEEDLAKKKKDVERVNQELFATKAETSNLKSKFDILQSEKEKNDGKLNLLEKDMLKKKEEVDKINQKQVNSEKEIASLKIQIENLKIEKSKLESERITQEKHQELLQDIQNQKNFVKDLQNQLNSLQSEKRTMENEWITPERKKKLIQEIENLQNQLKIERKRTQNFIDQLEGISQQELKEIAQKKLQERKNKLDQEKIIIGNKLEDNQKFFLEMMLVMQEQLDLLIFKGVNQEDCSPIKNQLQQNKDKLTGKITEEEIKSLCEERTEISKLEAQQKQWENLENLQLQAFGSNQGEQREAFVVVP